MVNEKETKRLRDWLPADADLSNNPKVRDLLNLEVRTEYGGMNEPDKPWVGTHKNVICWCVLITGHAVGWNENPAVGWSFPVKKIF